MAKLGLMFLVIFVLVQLTLAASRYPREAEEDPMKAFNDMFEQAKKTVSEAFTKENVDKAVASLSQAGESLQKVGADLVNSIKKASSEVKA